MDNIALPPRIVGGDFAGWLRDAMRSRGLSTRMLQLRTGIDHSTIYRLTLGQRQPSLATALALLRVLGEGSEESSRRG
jgi:transcriptional regulator with XRE-family HTH domain